MYRPAPDTPLERYLLRRRPKKHTATARIMMAPTPAATPMPALAATVRPSSSRSLLPCCGWPATPLDGVVVDAGGVAVGLVENCVVAVLGTAAGAGVELELGLAVVSGAGGGGGGGMGSAGGAVVSAGAGVVTVAKVAALRMD